MHLFQNAARVLTKDEQLNVVEEAKRRKAELMQACEERKNFMQTMELNRKENEKLSDLEQVYALFHSSTGSIKSTELHTVVL